MKAKTRVNNNYMYFTEDLIELKLTYANREGKEALPDNIKWAETNLVPESEYTVELISNNIRDLQPGEKLLVPVNLIGDTHWVGAMFEKDDRGNVKVTWMDSLARQNEGPNKRVHRDGIIRAQRALEVKLGVNIIDTKPNVKILRQQDGTSCGAMVMQNLLNAADPERAEDLTPQQIRTKHIEILGEDFARAQALSSRDPIAVHEDLLDKQLRRTDQKQALFGVFL